MIKHIKYLFLFYCLSIFIFNKANAQTYYKFSRSTSNTLYSISNITAITQSAGTAITLASVNDGSYTTGGSATTAIGSWISFDMGVSRDVSYVDLGTNTISNLNNRILQSSLDNLNWTDITTISGLVASQTKRINFPVRSARYFRIFNGTGASAAVDIREFAPEGVSKVIVPAALTAGRSVLEPLAFDFYLKGEKYNSFSVTSDGLIRLGSTVVTVEGTNRIRSFTNPAKLCAFWDDMATSTLATQGGIRSWVIGAKPNRIQVIDFRLNNANSSTGTNTVNFQVWIHETTNKIEYIYGNGTLVTNTATIGIGGREAPMDEFIAVRSTTASNGDLSYFNVNDEINLWPGNGTKYTFAIDTLPTVINIPTTDFPSLSITVGAMNWASKPRIGGHTINVSSSHSEIVPNGMPASSSPIIPIHRAGMLLTTSGTASSPIRFFGNGSRLYAGIGNTNWDFVFGLAGTDYVDVDSFVIRDTSINTTTAQMAEIGIGLFKRRFSTTIGNDGCQNIKITSNSIRLTRMPNQTKNSVSFYGTSTTYYYYWSESYLSRGIYASRFDSKHNGTPGAGISTSIYSINYPIGIRSQVDIHSEVNVNNNTIDSCSIGIEFGDAYNNASSVFAGENIIIGELGKGNKITNWGATPTQVYGNSNAYYNKGSIVAGIIATGMKNYSIKYNIIENALSETNTTTGIFNFHGISVGINSERQSFPIRNNNLFSVDISNNIIRNIDVTGSTLRKNANGILLNTLQILSNNSKTTDALNGAIDINNNAISSLLVRDGSVAAISTTYNSHYLSYFRNVLGKNSYQNNFLFTNGSARIQNNTIFKISKSPGSLTGISQGLFNAIDWIIPVRELYISSNSIGGLGDSALVFGSITTNAINKIAGFSLINVDMYGTNLSNRNIVNISKNRIFNIQRVAKLNFTTASEHDCSSAVGITLFNGGLTNHIDSNIIDSMVLANGLNSSSSTAFRSIHGIYAIARPRAGLSTLNISGNYINGITRNRFGQPGFTAYSSTLRGVNSYLSGITAENKASQIKNIEGNTIRNLRHVSDYAASNTSLASKLYGIYTTGGNVLNSIININKNTISNLVGDNWNSTSTTASISSTSIQQHTHAWSVVGVSAANYQRLSISNNQICNLSTNFVGSTATTYRAANGVVGICFGKSSSTVAATASTLGEAVFNNTISGLSAPNINAHLGVQGIYYWGYGRFAKIAHNTIALGSLDGGSVGRLNSTNANSFGVSGVTFNDINSRTSKTYKITFANNIIHVNATAKGSTGTTALTTTTTGGFNTAWRHLLTTRAKRPPLGFDAKSQGNVYFINNDLRNYIYAQGDRYALTSTTGFIRNAYGYFNGSPASYKHVASNLVNDTIMPKFFNSQCGKYKSFWGTVERSSFIDLSGSNQIIPVPFRNSGASCADRLRLIDNSYTYAGNVRRFNQVVDINADLFGVNRTVDTTIAGAIENNTVIGGDNFNIDFDFVPICDAVCSGNKTLSVKITPPIGKQISNVPNLSAPRVYYRRIINNNTITAAQTDSNNMVNLVNNNATGREGWRWVEAASVSGNQYDFVIDLNKLKNTKTTGIEYTIEYFVIAQTSDGLITSWSSGDFSNVTCPNSIDLFTVGGINQVPMDYDGPTSIDENSVQDNYTIYSPSAYTKHIYLENNRTNYTANNALAYRICKNEELMLKPRYFLTSLGFEDGAIIPECATYRMQVANDIGFTSGLQVFTSTDTIFKYNMPLGIKYFRFFLECDGTIVSGSNTSYIGVQGLECPINTTLPIANINSCIGTSQNINVRQSIADSSFYWVINPAGKPYIVPPALTTTNNRTITVNPTSTLESGQWRTYVTNSRNQTYTDQLVRLEDYLSEGEYNMSGSSASAGKGVYVKVNKFIRISKLSVVGADPDGSTTGWNIRLIGKNGQEIYAQAGASATDNTISNISPTNWFLPPGEYAIVMGETTAGTEPTGALAEWAIEQPVKVPNTLNPTMEVIGGVSDFNLAEIESGVAPYFGNISFIEYCTSDSTSFNYLISPTTCCAVAPNNPVPGLIPDNTFTAAVQDTFCQNIEPGWLYYYSATNPRRVLFAVHPNGNEWKPTETILYNTDFLGDSIHTNIQDKFRIEMMPYLLRIANSDSLLTKGGIKIRFYYPLTQFNSARKYTNKRWFYKESQDKESVVDDLVVKFSQIFEEKVPSITSTQSGINFVEFHNVNFVDGVFGFLSYDLTSCMPINRFIRKILKN